MRAGILSGARGFAFYAALWLLMMALRQDFWNWRDPSLVFGFLPVGLAYQAGYSIFAACVMAALVRYTWPREIEVLEESEADDARHPR